MALPGRSKIKLNLLYTCVFATAAVLLAACSGNKENSNPPATPVKTADVKKVPTPEFNADSAYSYVKAQVDFGPRTPGSAAHEKCAQYLTDKLKSYGFTVTVQTGTVKTFDGKQFLLKNIIAQFNPGVQSRIMLCSHWDTRPWADSDTKDKDKPFDSANDGPSGVGVAMEVARNVSISKPNIGVDIMYFDMEDYGEDGGDEDTWCLGTQYWASHMYPSNYYANFGVLLDMVGAPNATFPKESQSVSMAGSAVDKVWDAAAEIGYGNYFVSQTRQFVGVDDHIYVNKAGVPCIDIIEYNQATGGFGDYHHTHKDNMSIIDKGTLKAVGQTLLEVIYSEK